MRYDINYKCMFVLLKSGALCKHTRGGAEIKYLKNNES